MNSGTLGYMAGCYNGYKCSARVVTPLKTEFITYIPILKSRCYSVTTVTRKNNMLLHMKSKFPGKEGYLSC